MAGKGDARRPSLVPEKDVDANWQKIFGRKVRRTPPRPTTHGCLWGPDGCPICKRYREEMAEYRRGR